MKRIALLSILALCLSIPAFAAVGIFDKTADWTTGATKAAGSVSATGSGDASVYTIKGNGDDIWNNADEGFFAYKSQTGSFSIQAKLKWVNPGTNQWSKMGLMIREKGSDSASKHYSVIQRGGGAGALGDQMSIQMRYATAGGSNGWDLTEAYPDGVWFRVNRYAPLNLFWGEYSTDGKTWTVIQANAGIVGLPMTDSVDVGLCITNHDADTNLVEASVSDVKITELTAAPSQIVNAKLGDFDGDLDIGNFVNEGDATYNATTKTYTVAASGDDIWNSADAFHYVYKKMTGAYEIEGEFNITVVGDGTWTKAGLMVRSGLGTSDANAFGLIRVDNQFAMAGRDAFLGASTDSTYTADHVNRFKLIKLGGTVTGYIWDGSKWVVHSSKTIPAAAETFAGLAITSHSTSMVAEAEFTNIKFAEYPFEVSRIPEITTYSPGQTFSVSMVIDVRDGQKVDSLVIKEIVPAKASAITNISDGGKLENGTITWTLSNITADKTLTYNVTAPDDLNIATLTWGTGSVTSAGVEFPLGASTVELITFNVAENFSYPSNNSNELKGKTMDARSGGFGWSAGWTALKTTEAVVLDTSTLDAGVVQSQPVTNHDTGAETNPGNYSVKLSGDVSTGLSRKLPVVADGGEIWISFTFKEEGPAASHWSGMTIINQKGEEVSFVGKPYQAAFAGIGNLTGSDALTKVPYTQANHILVRVVVKGANSKVYMWVNPDKTDRLDTSDASGADNIDNIAEIRLRRGGATGSAYYDNLWISSVPALPPAGAGRVDLQIDNPNRPDTLPAWDVISIDQIDDAITGVPGYGHDNGNNYYLIITGCLYYSDAGLTTQVAANGLPIDHMSGLNGHILGPYNNAAFEDFKNSIKFMNNGEQTGPFTFNMVPEGKYRQLRSAQTVGNGDGQLLCKLNYADGTSEDSFLHGDDWFNDASEIRYTNTRQLVNGMDRLDGSSVFSDANDPSVFECYIDVNPDKVLKSVTLELDTTGASSDAGVGYNLFDIWAQPAASGEPVSVNDWSLF